MLGKFIDGVVDINFFLFTYMLNRQEDESRSCVIVLCTESARRNRLDKAWVALGKFLEEFVYLAVKICHRGTLPSATPSFQVGKSIENRKKHQRRRIAWVGQADFGKLELNLKQS